MKTITKFSLDPYAITSLLSTKLIPIINNVKPYIATAYQQGFGDINSTISHSLIDSLQNIGHSKISFIQPITETLKSGLDAHDGIKQYTDKIPNVDDLDQVLFEYIKSISSSIKEKKTVKEKLLSLIPEDLQNAYHAYKGNSLLPIKHKQTTDISDINDG